MPQSSSEQSLVTNFHPVLMGNSDISVKDEFGQTNPLQVGDYTSGNGELVNLENACVNIDNSSDVIIGPVTQFNVNGNVTIYQNENGQQRTIDEEGTEEDTTVPNYDGVNFKRPVPTPCHSLLMVCSKGSKNRVVFVTVAILVSATASVILFILSQQTSPMTEKTVDGPCYEENLGYHKVYKREDWNAIRPLAEKKLPHPTSLVIISHSATSPCDSFESCAREIQIFQYNHVFDLRLDDICYNFLIGGDGNVYSGRGWDTVNCHKKLSIGINFIGNFEVNTLNETMIDCIERLLDRGVSRGILSEDYILVGHNQTTDTLSPGKNAYEVIKTFSHFSDNDMRK